MGNSKSTLGFRSNIYPLNKDLQKDSVFLSKIHDPFSLKALKESYRLTDIQEREYRRASEHCVFAYKDDYPWGTIVDKSGVERVVCKCIKTDCKHFESCRSDFEPDELKVLEENRYAQPAVFKFYENINKKGETADGDIAATITLFEDSKSGFGSAQMTDIREDLTGLVVPDSFAIHKSQETDQLSVVNKRIDFGSFVESEQDDIIVAEPTERTFVNAGPGTGKTWTLVEKIIYMLNEAQAEAENILILCFSRSAVEVIRSRLLEAANSGRVGYEWKGVDVRTFDSFSTYMLAWVQDNCAELLPQPFSLESCNYDTRIRMAVSVLKKKRDMLVGYEHIIVDEVQDLVGSRAELVLEMLKGLPESCGFTILGDSCQSLYDYMADDPAVMSSMQFYQGIFKNFTKVNYYSLTENHRQGDELGVVTLPLRRAILIGTVQDRANAVSDLLNNIEKIPVKLQCFNRHDAADYTQRGTLGILTRTNGQALQISTWLRNEDVPHVLQRSINAQTLGDWISGIFYEYDNATIDETSFMTRHLELFPKINSEIARERWAALVSTQYGEPKRRYEVDDILRGLTRNVKDPALFKSNSDKQYNIIVSNVHRAKGMEFDSVIVIDDVIESVIDSEKDDILEHKVCYVALTRAKKRIERVEIPKQYIYIARNETRRCSKASSGKHRKPYISHFEVGAGLDLDTGSFGGTQELQYYIRDEVQPGTRLKLIKCAEGTKDYVVYRIVVEDAENFTLGYTSALFACELEKAIQRIKNLKENHAVLYPVYPHAFCDVYVDSINTCISESASAPTGAKTFGKFSIWMGISIVGFAAVDKDTY